MPVYVDGLVKYRSGNWCHMWADSLPELHDMAMQIGLRPEWFQNREGFPHYDLRAPKRLLALRRGAQFKP